MKSALLQAILTLLILFVAGAVYWFAIADDERYNLFDLLKGRPITAVIGGGEIVGQTVTEAPVLRAEPVDLNSIELLESVNSALSDLTEAVVPSVVSIDTTKNVKVSRMVRADPFGMFAYRQNQNYEAPGLGSGVVVSADGHIVTNHHVVAGVDEIRITMHDGSQYEADWVGSDPNVDVAVLKLIAPEEGELPPLQPLSFGDSDTVRVGEMVMAVGNPFGLNETVTRGIISAKQRELSDGANEYFQVDAVINPGNSGGPLVNVRGEIIGINVAIFTGQQDVRAWQGIGLAIPSREVQEVFEAIVLGRPLIRGYLGLELENITRRYALALGLRTTQGALITDVMSGSPAEEAGLKPGDVIQAFDQKATKSAEDALARIRAKKSGEVADLTIFRQGARVEVSVASIAKSDPNTLQFKTDTSAPGRSIVDAIGIEVSDLTPNQRAGYGISEAVPAILVSGVKPGSQAQQRFQVGDLIHRVNRDAVTDVSTFYELMGSLPRDQTTVLFWSRNGEIKRAFMNP